MSILEIILYVLIGLGVLAYIIVSIIDKIKGKKDKEKEDNNKESQEK